MTKGVVLIAIGSRGYAYMAYNMAYSIKHNSPNVHVHLIADNCFDELPLNKRGVFDSWSTPEHDDYHTGQSIDPGKLKTRIYKYLPFDENLYLDVDGICVKDIEPIIAELSKDERNYITSEQGRGKLTEKINYSEWATNEAMKRVFTLNEDADLVAIQSSWCFIRKNKESKSFFLEVEKAFDKVKLTDLNLTWGGTIPDEMVFSGVISKRGLKVNGPKSVIFFGAASTHETSSDIETNYYILSIYGNGNGKTMTPLRYFEMYDKMLFNWMREHRNANDKLAENHIYKAGIIKQYKHANNSKRL